MKFFMDHKASPDWAVRRRIIILTLIWSASLVTYLAVFGRPSSMNEAIATNLIILMVSVIGSYVFGAVWEQNVARKTDVAQAAVDQGAADTQVKVEP